MSLEPFKALQFPLTTHATIKYAGTCDKMRLDRSFMKAVGEFPRKRLILPGKISPGTNEIYSNNMSDVVLSLEIAKNQFHVLPLRSVISSPLLDA